MIISVSRRSDIPAFYSRWIVERLRQGFCLVPNPFDPRKVARVSLQPQDVDCLVFWTRYPQPLLESLPHVERDYKCVFFVTITGSPRWLEQKRPPVEKAVEGVRRLARLLGPGRVVWRYDPVVLSEATPPVWHLQNFARLAWQLEGHTHQVKLSLFEGYRKNRPRLSGLLQPGKALLAPHEDDVRQLFAGLAAIARARGMQASACAQGGALTDCGVPAGACIDAAWLHQELGLVLPGGKDPSQRKDCTCIPSRDIGMYDSCLFGCRYCYATSSWRKGRGAYVRHDPLGPSLLPVPGLQEKSGNRRPSCSQLFLPLE